MHSRTRARPARSPLVTLIGKRRSAFASVADAVAYLEPGLQFGTPGTITVYGSRRAFGVLRSRMKNAISAVIAHHYTIANRWMAEATSWGDHFDSKDMRDDLFKRHDLSASWLQYGGVEPPPSSSVSVADISPDDRDER